MPPFRELELVLLGVLAREPSHGHRIRQQLHVVDRARPIGASSVYAGLQRLERDGLVTSELVSQEKTPARRVYTITEHGMRKLENQHLIATTRLAESRGELVAELATQTWLLDALSVFSLQPVDGSQRRIQYG